MWMRGHLISCVGVWSVRPSDANPAICYTVYGHDGKHYSDESDTGQGKERGIYRVSRDDAAKKKISRKEIGKTNHNNLSTRQSSASHAFPHPPPPSSFQTEPDRYVHKLQNRLALDRRLHISLLGHRNNRCCGIRKTKKIPKQGLEQSVYVHPSGGKDHSL